MILLRAPGVLLMHRGKWYDRMYMTWRGKARKLPLWKRCKE